MRRNFTQTQRSNSTRLCPTFLMTKNLQKAVLRRRIIIAQSQKRLKNHDEAALSYLNALSVYTALQEPKAIARTLNNLATIERQRGDNIKALDYAIRGLALRENIDDPEGQAKALIGAGIIYRLLGRYEKSLDHIHQAHLYYKSINNVDANCIFSGIHFLCLFIPHRCSGRKLLGTRPG